MFPRGVNIHERFLRHIWSRQYLRPAELKTTDGKRVTVLDVGTLNSDGGPDFRDAKIRIGGTVFFGDVEIHRNVMEWLQHRHETDSGYNKVILHVVLEGDFNRYPTVVQSGRAIPVLMLEPFLSESLRSLWQRIILDERAQSFATIPCFDRNQEIPSELLEPWLRKLSIERVELKLRRFEERLWELAGERHLKLHEPWRAYGRLRVEGFPEEIPSPGREFSHKDLAHRELWEQVLYEGIMDGLGYNKNRDSFVRLARSLTLHTIRSFKLDKDPTTLQAGLFGVAGLLPKFTSLQEKESRQYVRMLAHEWNGVRRLLRIERLHTADWQFFPTRPANFPTIRIAAASHLLLKLLHHSLFRDIIQTIKSDESPDTKQKRLQAFLSVETVGYWRHHWHFDAPSGRPVNALGAGRINDITCNTIVPLSLLYARVFRDRSVREGVLGLFEHFPPLSENSITRLMERQLLKGRFKLEGANLQQGVIQLYKYYCTKDRCRECEVGKVVF